MNRNYTILVIDDEPVMLDSCFEILSRKGCDIWLAGNGREGMTRLRERLFDVVVLDLKMPDVDGFEILRTIHAEHPETVVIVITGYPTIETAVEAMKLGARDFIPKPFTPNTLRTILSRALKAHHDACDAVNGGQNGSRGTGLDAIIGESSVMRRLKDYIRKSATSDCPVLITGDTGTGKELVARALHHYSRRRDNNFVTIDSGGLVDTLIESELFGHAKGSFTGAMTDRVGRFEMADKGTLFFDEIANMSMRIQTRLLRVLQEQEITPVGCLRLVPVDVRIIAATNTDLEQEIHRGLFRDDLYYRLNVIPVHVPPLRERPDDIPLLATYFLDRFRAAKNGPAPVRITDGAMKTMMHHSWPGNVRELQHLIRRAVALSESEEVDPFEITGTFGAQQSYGGPTAPTAATNLEEIERQHIIGALRRHGHNKTRTARVLGIDRKTLRNKMKKYDILDSLPETS